MSVIIPLKAVPSQFVTVQLGGQNCQINVYQRFYGVFVDLYIDNAIVIAGVPAKNLCLIVRSAYLGFSGDIAFVDTQGSTDPVYTGIGTRYLLTYWAASELA
jgi:hypothetical protein